MAKLAKRQMIQVSPDVYEDLYAIKGPERTFGQMIRELIDAAFPPEKEDDSQTTLAQTCPECDELLEDGVCPGCGYPDEE
jgi:rubrerythrin